MKEFVKQKFERDYLDLNPKKKSRNKSKNFIKWRYVKPSQNIVIKSYEIYDFFYLIDK